VQTASYYHKVKSSFKARKLRLTLQDWWWACYPKHVFYFTLPSTKYQQEHNNKLAAKLGGAAAAAATQFDKDEKLKWAPL
jgi:hypothetical protein